MSQGITNSSLALRAHAAVGSNAVLWPRMSASAGFCQQAALLDLSLLR